MKMKVDKTIISARTALNYIYEEFRNHYLTVAKFSEHNGITEKQGQKLIELARDVYNSKHPEE